MTFTGNPPGEVARMAGARFAITGSSANAAVQAKRVVGLLGGVAVEIPEERRALYHAALCHASNHLVTLIADAAQALERAGVDAPRALLAPLVQAALDNSLDRGFDALRDRYRAATFRRSAIMLRRLPRMILTLSPHIGPWRWPR